MMALGFSVQPLFGQMFQKTPRGPQVPAADNELRLRMRKVWRSADGLLADVEKVKRDDDPEIGDSTFRAWWSGKHRISWAGGLMIERAIAFRAQQNISAVSPRMFETISETLTQNFNR